MKDSAVTVTLFIDELRGLPAMIGGLSTQQASVGKGWAGEGNGKGRNGVQRRERGWGMEGLFCSEVMMRGIKKM